MAKVIKFQRAEPAKFGLKRVKGRKKVDLEEYGQLNVFAAPPPAGKVINLGPRLSPFETALSLDEQEDELVKEAYLKAIQAGDSVADAYCNLGILEFRDGNVVKAIDCFNHSLKTDPRHFQSHYNLANIYSEEGNLTLARLHYEVCMEAAPEFPHVYYNLGLVLALIKDYKEAIKVLTRFTQLAPEEDWGNAMELLEGLKVSLLTPNS